MIESDRRNSIAGWFFEPNELSESLEGKGMLNPSIDLSNPCNLNCPYCYIEEKDSARKIRRANELTLEETLQVLDDLRESGAKTINLVGAGEPTIDPHFEAIIEHIYSRGMKTVLFTNGIAFNTEPLLARYLYQHDVSVVIKINSFVAEVQDLVAGREGYTKRRDQALELLIDCGFTSHEPTRLGADIIAFKGNVHEIPNIHRWCREQNIFPIAGEFIPAGRTEHGEFHGNRSIAKFDRVKQQKISTLLQPISSDERMWLRDELTQIDEAFCIQRPKHYAYFGGGICTQILGVYVDIEGNIWPCVAKEQRANGSFISTPLGNVRKGDLPSKLWRKHPYLKAITRSFDGGCPYKAQIPEERLVANVRWK